MATECAAKQCAKGCTGNDGGYCAGACTTIITCIQANPSCGTAADPMCVQRGKSTGTANKCTMQWESAGGGSLPLQGPALAAVGLFECACGMMVPTSGAGGAGTGGASGKGGAGGTSGKAGT
jgi:hypothetical protein